MNFGSKKYTWEKVCDEIRKLKEKHRDIRVRTIGKSVMGKDVFALSMGEGKNKILINSADCANEWTTVSLILKFADEFMTAVEKKENICGFNARELYMGARLCLVPLINPDGLDLVNGAMDKNSPFYKKACEIAKNCSSVKFPEEWEANIEGVDIRLNYPAMWFHQSKISSVKDYAPRGYNGPYPLSSPEARCIYEYIQREGFSMTLSYDNAERVIYWRCTDCLPFESSEVARILGRASGYGTELLKGVCAYGVRCENSHRTIPERKDNKVMDYDRFYRNNEGLIASAVNMVLAS